MLRRHDRADDLMLVAALRDLQWRRRRFLIAMGGTALVFGMTLLMTGVAAGFDAEAAGTVADLDADAWAVKEGAAGPFLGASPLGAAEAEAIAALPGVEAAGPMVFTRRSVRSVGGVEIDVNVIGAEAGGLGMPAADRGSAPATPGEVLISSQLGGFEIGDPISISGLDLHVVGVIHGSTALAGTPNVFLTLQDAQVLGFAGQPIASAIAVRGAPAQLPDGFELMSNDAARADLLRAIAKAKDSLSLISLLLWLVAASIIGAVAYLSVLERQRDFAVFKATGVTTTSIMGGLALQSAVIALVAALAGSLIGALLGPRFPMIVSLEASAHLMLPVIAVAVGVAASLIGLRRVVALDPALAFGGP